MLTKSCTCSPCRSLTTKRKLNYRKRCFKFGRISLNTGSYESVRIIDADTLLNFQIYMDGMSVIQHRAKSKWWTAFQTGQPIRTRRKNSWPSTVTGKSETTIHGYEIISSVNHTRLSSMSKRISLFFSCGTWQYYTITVDKEGPRNNVESKQECADSYWSSVNERRQRQAWGICSNWLHHR